MADNIDSVISALEKVIDPEIGLPITDLGMVGNIDLTATELRVEIKLTVGHCPMRDEIEKQVRASLDEAFPAKEIQVAMSVMTKTELDELKLKLRGKDRTNPFGENSATRVILVSSGKGGVGKSTITANLAVGLARLGFQVGLVDADIFGFSIPRLMSISAKPTRVDDMMMPPIAFGVKTISIGMFLPDNEPVSWRGPMLHKAIEQFLTDVYWGSLDFLIVDMPPGTGDVAISIGQLLPQAKVLVVTSPASAAAEVAVRSAMAASKAGQEILGVVENMSWLTSEDGQRQHIFGSGGSKLLIDALAKYTGKTTKVLAQIPVSAALSESTEAGIPYLSGQTEDEAGIAFGQLVSLVAETKLGQTSRNLQVKLKP